MAFAPSSRFTAYDILSMARELSKTTEIAKVLEAQGKFFYKMSLLEIVTLLNGATEKAYTSMVEAWHRAQTSEQGLLILADTAEALDEQYTFACEDDPLLGPNYQHMLAINILQKRYKTDGESTLLDDPLVGRQRDKINSIEHRIELEGESMRKLLLLLLPTVSFPHATSCGFRAFVGLPWCP